MSNSVSVVWDDALAAYNFGPSHPLAPVRVELTMALARDLHVLDAVTMTKAAPADDATLQLVHSAAYVEAVKRAGTPPTRADIEHGLGTPDDPVFEGMHDASALVAGASVAAARAIWLEGADHAA